MSTINRKYRSRQDVFNTAWAHCIKQGKLSEYNGACKYFDSEGNMCAIGCMLTPAQAKAWDMELKSGIRYLPGYMLENARLNPKDRNFLAQIQGAHDGCTEGGLSQPFVVQFKAHMMNVARKYRLKIPAEQVMT